MPDKAEPRSNITNGESCPRGGGGGVGGGGWGGRVVQTCRQTAS